MAQSFLGTTGALDLVGSVPAGLRELRAPALPVPADVDHDPGAVAGVPVHREPRQLLQRFEDFSPGAHQLIQGRADHGDHGAVAFHIHVDVPVQVGDIEQPFNVVRGYLAFEFQVCDIGQSRGRPSRLPVRARFRRVIAGVVPRLVTGPGELVGGPGELVGGIGLRRASLLEHRPGLGLLCGGHLRVGDRAFPLAHDRGLLRSGLTSPGTQHSARRTPRQRLTACRNACCVTAAAFAA